jgi:hypothetical protein
MTAYNYLYLIAVGLIVIGWGAQMYAEGDVTVVGASSSTSTVVPAPGLAPDGTPIVHKSLHKKRNQTTATASSASPPASASASGGAMAPSPAKTMTSIPAVDPKPTVALTPFTPTVETGLPVARHSGAVTMYAAPISPGGSLPGTVSYGGAGTGFSYHPSAATGQTKPATSMVSSMTPGLAAIPTSYASPKEHKKTNVYPWKRNIITTMFWIGEGGSSLSDTTQESSAWIQDWRAANGGLDNPDRKGYLDTRHVATVNPFYVALPFNDLAYPDKARRWVPPNWHRPNRDGKQVSACKDRWIEIKNGQGQRCFAQWEDVGPLRSDHAEYVFGDERPDTLTRAGLDLSPAVAKYLGIDGEHRSTTSWHFVDDEDVEPGPWLRLDEQALLYAAMKELRNSNPSAIPIPKNTAPVDDPSNVDNNKRKIGAAKG